MNQFKINRKTIRSYLNWCFCLVFLLSVAYSATGQNRKKQQFFNYEESGRKYVGSFNYEFLVENGENDHDLLANPVVDFTDLKKEVRLVISNLRLRKGITQELEFKNIWRRYSSDKIQSTSSRDIRLSMRSRPQVIRFKVVDDGVVRLIIGFAPPNAPFVKNRPEFLRLSFTAKGVSQSTETPTDVAKEREKRIWEKIKRVDEERYYADFIKKYPNSEYVRLAEEAIKRIQGISNKPVEPQPVPEIPQEPTEEEKAWEVTVKEGTILSYQYFIDTYPDHEYAEKAEKAIVELNRKIPLEINVHERDDRFVFIFHNAEEPQIVRVEPNEQLSLWLFEDSIEVLLEKKELYKFTFKDKIGRTKTLEIDHSMPPLTGKVKVKNGTLEYEGHGGMPPYFLEIRDDTDHIVNRMTLVGDKGTLPFKKLGNGLNGTYTINLMDKRKSVSQTFENIVIKQQKYKINIWLVVGVITVVVILFFVARYFYKQLYGNEFEM